MASEFLASSAVRRFAFSNFSQSTVASFSTAFNADWGAYFGGTAPQLLATTAQPTQAILIVPNGGPTLYINNGVARTPTDGVTTNLSTTVTSATAFFNQSDLYASITGTGIPANTTIAAVNSPTSVTLSAAATATGSGLSIVITRVGGDWVTGSYGTWIVVPAYLMGRVVADGATNSNTTVTSASAAFTSRDVGAVIATANLPVGTTIASVTNATTVVTSAAATATGTSQAMTITPVNSLFTPDIV